MAFIQSYIEKVISAHTKPPWSPQALETTVSKGSYASSCNPEMNTFIWGEMKRRIKDGFIILFPAADSVRTFGEKLSGPGVDISILPSQARGL